MDISLQKGFFKISQRAKSNIITVGQVLLGTLFFILCSRINIPFRPVPISMQTFGVFSLAIALGGRKACFSLLTFLGLASLGAPVLAYGANPLWMLGTTGGYLLGYPIAAFVIGKMIEMKPNGSVLWLMTSIFCGQVIIYALGVSVLSTFIGWKQSFYLGVAPFLLAAAAKLVLASSLGGFYLRFKKRG